MSEAAPSAHRVEAATEGRLDLACGLALQYASVSLRGYYPEDPEKPNQDAFSILTHFPPDSNTKSTRSFFGVFDGHGEHGHDVAQFVRDALPQQLLKALHDMPNDIGRAYRDAFLRTDRMVDASPKVDDHMSGTTAVVVLIEGDMLHIANVGDSRVIIGQRKDGKLLAFPLSIDQTPYRQDEYNRVRMTGARIMSGDQMDEIRDWHDSWAEDMEELGDDDSDPPRIWLPDDCCPGCAFSRSLGDRVAKEVGVIALPELLDKQITENDEYVVLCSDGVFEFISNQMAMDIVEKCGEPLAACYALVQEAYKLWLQFDVRTDDITAIVLKLYASAGEAPDPSSVPRELHDPTKRRSSCASWTERRSSLSSSIGGTHVGGRRSSAEGVGIGFDVIAGEQLRPVRRGVSKEKKRAMVMGGDTANAPEAPEESAVTLVQPKIDAADVERVRGAVQGNFLFSHLDGPQQTQVIAEMEVVSAPAGTRVIEQGQRGDWFYVVAEGTLDVVVQRPGHAEPSWVYSYDASKKGPAPSFGDLALLYKKARAASVVARSDCTLWRLHGDLFRKRLQKSTSSELVPVLRKVEILSSLSYSELHQLIEALSQTSHADGETVIEQGEISDAFYIIRDGEVVVSRKEAGETMRIGKHGYFGERALLLDAPRAATVKAAGAVELLYIRRRAFEQILGPLQLIMNHDRRLREKAAYSQQLHAEAEHLLNTNLSDYSLCADVLADEVSSLHLAVCEVTGAAYSVRVISKAKAAAERQQANIMSAATLVAEMKAAPSRFLPQVVAAFADECRLFSVMSSRIVCELSQLFDPKRPFNEPTMRFYASCVLLALESLQFDGIVLRSLSPETIALTAEGFGQVLDFRLAKKLPEGGRTFTLCGTPQHMAPEMLSGRGHGCEVDLWALGTIMYEMLSGRAPFEGATELQLYGRIGEHTGTTAGPPADPPEGKKQQLLDFPVHFSEEVCDVLDILLQPEPGMRSGGGGAGLEPLRQHAWFETTNWDALAHGEVKPPHAKEAEERLHDALAPRTARSSEGYKRRLHNQRPPRGEDSWADDFEFCCRFTTTERTDGQNGDATPAAYSRPVSFARTRRSSTRASHIEI